MKTRMKIVLILAMILSFGLSVGACSKKNEKKPGQTSENLRAAEAKIAAQKSAATADSNQTVSRSLLFTFDQEKTGNLPVHFSQNQFPNRRSVVKWGRETSS